MNRNLLFGLLALVAVSVFFMLSTEPNGDSEIAQTGSMTEASKQSSVGLITDERIINLESEEPGNWLSHGRTYEETRFSPLTQINKETVSQLGLAWYKDMGTNRAQESTPIIVDDIMYLTSSWSIVYAIDAKTGETLWRYDPEVPGEHARKA